MTDRQIKRPSRRARVKIQDVARLAEVSLSTVSGVLNQKSNIRPETREKVLEVIARLGYTPNLFASNLARRHTRLIGIIVSDLLNPFFAEIASALDSEARRHGYQTFLSSTGFQAERQSEAVREMLSLRVAGIAMMTSENDPEAYAILKASGTPCVYLDHAHPAANVGTVRVDKRHGMFLAVQHLLDLGHRRILLVKNSQQGATEPPMLSHLERQIGFEDAVHRLGSMSTDVHMIDEPGHPAAAGLCAVQRALGSFEFTAVVAINDLVALGAFRGLLDAGLRIPEDVSVVGFDNTYLCDFLHPALTTVATPRADLAQGTIRMLLELVEGHSASLELVLPAALVARESTAAPPAA